MQIQSRPFVAPSYRIAGHVAAPVQGAVKPAESRDGAVSLMGAKDWLDHASHALTGGYYRVKDFFAKLIPGSPEKPAETQVPTDADTVAELHAARKSWFMSQTHGVYNTQEDTWGNANCGPTSLAMVAKAFGKITPGPDGVDAAIEDARKRIGQSQSEREGTSTTGIVRGAQSYGLSAYAKQVDTLDQIKAELDQNRLVIASVVPKYLGPFQTGGHLTVVTAVQDGKVYLNDPWKSDGPTVVDANVFLDSLKSRNRTIVTVGEGY